MHVVVWIATGLAAGWIARVVLRRRRHGVLVDLSLGLLGALVGGALTRQLGIAARELRGGAIIFLSPTAPAAPATSS